MAITQKRVTAQGNETTYDDHILKIDMAKEIAMIQRNAKGKHYYKLEGEQLKDFKRLVENFYQPLYKEIKFASVLILWTKSEWRFSIELQVEYQSRKIGRD